jgi:acyl carrier protein
VRETTLDAYAWQDIPFHKVVAAVRPPRDLGCNPIFQVDFSFHDSAMPAFDVPGARGRLVYTPFRAAKFDLNVTIVPGRDDDPLLVMWQYSTDLFDEASIRKLMACYDEVVRDAVAHPDRRLSELSIMPELLRTQLLAPSSGRGAPPPEPSPCDDVELALRATWGEAFDEDDVPMRDSFFARGGTSIMAAQVVQRLRQTFGVRLPITAVFHHDTIAELAEHIRSSAPAVRPALVPVQLRGSRLPVFWVPGRSGTAARLLALGRRLGADQPLYGIAVADDATDLDGVAAGAAAALQQVQPIGPFTLASPAEGEPIAHAIARLLRQAGREAHTVALAPGQGTGGAPHQGALPTTMF